MSPILLGNFEKKKDLIFIFLQFRRIIFWVMVTYTCKSVLEEVEKGGPSWAPQRYGISKASKQTNHERYLLLVSALYSWRALL